MEIKWLKGTYKVVAVIVSFVAPDPYLNFIITSFTCCFEEILGKKLSFIVEFVAFPLSVGGIKMDRLRVEQCSYIVNQYMNGILRFCNKLSCVILIHCFFTSALQITIECLLPPRTFRGIGDWSESRGGTVLLGL